ncbi:MAG: hypothetical protein LBM62_02005 [Mediterranea sp.]|jgi:hypothetical protein|nr:hypothetical protein [Mediterranea sp.]
MKHKLFLFITFVAAAFLASCSNDDEVRGLRADECEVELQLASVYRSANTRAVADEEVKTLDILVFDGNGVSTDSATFLYSRVAWLKSDGATYQAIIKKADGLDLYFAVNAHALVTSGKLTEDMTWSAAKQALTLASPATLGTNMATAGLPMWGEAPNVNVNTDATYQNLGTIKLVRAVASADVSVTKTNFTLQEGWIANAVDKGFLPYDAANMSAAASFLFNKADMPAAVTFSDWSYTVPTGDSAIVDKFYMYENDSIVNTKVILKGLYTGTDGKGTATYYPLAFKDPADATKKRAATRNTKFHIVITKVNADGYNTIEEAKNGEEVNMEYDVVEWDESSPGDIWVDGPKYFSVDQRWNDVHVASYAGGVVDLEFQTNYDIDDIAMKLNATDAGVTNDTLKTDRFAILKVERPDSQGVMHHYFRIITLKDYDENATDNPQDFIIDVNGKLSFTMKVTQDYGTDGWFDGYDVEDTLGTRSLQHISPIKKLITHE